MINEKGLHDCCECSHLETKIREVRSTFNSGLLDENDCHEQVKVLILRDMFDQYRSEFMGAISKLRDELEESIDADLLEEVYGEPEGGFEEAEQSVDVFDYGDDKSITVLAVYDLNVEQLETLRELNIVY